MFRQHILTNFDGAPLRWSEITAFISRNGLIHRHRHHSTRTVPIKYSAVKRSIGSTIGCTITEKAPTRAFSWLKAPTRAFTFKTLC